MAEKSSILPKFILGALAGAAAAYLFDRENGASRRSMLMDRANSLSGDLKKFADEKMNFVRDRAEDISGEFSGRTSQMSSQGSAYLDRSLKAQTEPRTQSSTSTASAGSIAQGTNRSTNPGSNLQ